MRKVLRPSAVRCRRPRSPGRGNPHPQYERYPGHSFTTDHANLQGSTFVEGGQQGNQEINREVDVLNRLPGLVKHPPNFKLTCLQRGLKPFPPFAGGWPIWCSWSSLGLFVASAFIVDPAVIVRIITICDSSTIRRAYRTQKQDSRPT